MSRALHTLGSVVDRGQAGIHVSLMLGDEFHANQHQYATTGNDAGAIKAIAAGPSSNSATHRLNRSRQPQKSWLPRHGGHFRRAWLSWVAPTFEPERPCQGSLPFWT